MDNIIQFPTRGVRDWAIIERSLQSGLLALGTSQAVQQRITERMRSFYEFADPDFNFSVNVDVPISASEEQVAAIRTEIGRKISAASEEKLQAFTKELFIERLECEINFCRELGLI